MPLQEQPAGITSIHGGAMEILCILPNEQNKGYGTEL